MNVRAQAIDRGIPRVTDRNGARMIVNPTSGRGLGETLYPTLLDSLRTRWPELEGSLTATCEDAEHAAQTAAREGIRTLIVVGGDGTLNSVVNGVAHVEGALAQTTFGVLPGGTGNDLAGTLGFDASLEEAAELLRFAQPRTIDLGMLDDRIFTNVSAGGLFAEASEATSSEAKSLAGRLAYLLAGPRVLLEHEGVELELRATTPYGPLSWRGTIAMFAVCNAPTAGGGNALAPLARYDDGWLDAFVVEEASALGLARVLLEITGGTHLDDEHVVAFRASELELSFARPTLVNVDGEVGLRDHACYRILPGATRILVAPDASQPPR